MRLSFHTAEVQADAIAPLFDGGLVDIFPGSMPESPETPVTAQPLATIALPDPAFLSQSGGVLHGAPIAPALVLLTGTATWCRAYTAGRADVLFDGPVAVGGGTVNLNTIRLTAGGFVRITVFTYTVPGI